MSEATGRGREVRLLVVTIVVSIGMLLLLARLRFPRGAETEAPDAQAAAPLERLAAQATYEELAAIMAEMERRVAPSIVALSLEGDRAEPVYAAAVRLTPDRAIAVVGADDRVLAPTPHGVRDVVSRDAVRGLVVVLVDPRPGDVVAPRSGAFRAGPRYVAVVEATAYGPAVRPVYVGRMDLFQDPRSGEGLLRAAAAQQTIPRGSAIFSLEGLLIGLASEAGGVPTIVPVERLQALVHAAPSAPVHRGDPGVEVQDLSPAIAKAVGAASGVIVAHVSRGGPAEGHLQALDVIERVDGQAIGSVAQFHDVLRQRAPGTNISLAVRRGGTPVAVTLQTRPPGSPPDPAETGAVLQPVAGVGAEVLSVAARSPAVSAGVQRGDVIVALNGRPEPDPAAIERAFRTAKSGQALLLTIRRGAQHRILAIERP